MFGSWIKRKSRADKSKRSDRGSRSAQPWDPQRTLAGARILVAAATLVAVIVGWRAMSASLHRYVLERHGGAVSSEQVQLVDAPTHWMSPLVQEELRRAVAQRISGDPLDGRSLMVASLQLEANPWVASVRQVRRQPDGTIAVSAVYREPVAVVQTVEGSWRLVDAEGVSLPGLYAQYQAMQLRLPRITGATQVAPPPGRRWTAVDVLAGLELVLRLKGEPYAQQITAYDVRERDTRGRVRLVLLTEQGMVRWGLPPGDELSIEPDAATKLDWLRRVHRDLGTIDAGGKVLDLYGAEPMTFTTIEASRRTGL